MGAHPADTNTYIVEIENDEGGVKKSVNISVIDDSPKIEFLIVITVGTILTILLLTLVILYAVKANSSAFRVRSVKFKLEAATMIRRAVSVIQVPSTERKQSHLMLYI